MSEWSSLLTDLVINSLSKVSVILSAFILLKMASSKSLELFKLFSLDSSFFSCSVFSGTTITGAGTGAGLTTGLVTVS